MLRNRYSSGQVLNSAAREGDSDPMTGFGSSVMLTPARLGAGTDISRRVLDDHGVVPVMTGESP